MFKFGLAGAAAVAMPRISGAASASLERTEVFRSAFATLDKYLVDVIAKSRLDYGNGLKIWANGNYPALWPDDFLYPLMVHPSLMTPTDMTQLAALLAASMVDMNALPDRVQSDGLPVMQPGGLRGPHAHQMPLHLPAAWVRLLDYLQAMGATIERKSDWARVVCRAIELLPFSCGLAYVDPQRPAVGFGFHDTTAITGFELISSLVLHRGLQRAVKLFDGVAERAVLKRWTRLADGIKSNLHRLYDPEQGAFLAGSVDCRQVNVWANGLAYGLVDDRIQKKIADWYFQHREQIFKFGYTRQMAEPNGWQRLLVDCPVGTYVNGGFWSTGTGYVLPVLARHYPELAVELTQQMVENLPRHNFAESMGEDGKRGTNPAFITGIAMPMVGLKSILENRPLIEYF
jgi:hypothetical protein